MDASPVLLGRAPYLTYNNVLAPGTRSLWDYLVARSLTVIVIALKVRAITIPLWPDWFRACACQYRPAGVPSALRRR
jgi:hypothetical protein